MSTNNTKREHDVGEPCRTLSVDVIMDGYNNNKNKYTKKAHCVLSVLPFGSWEEICGKPDSLHSASNR